VRELLTMEAALPAVERAFLAHGFGEAVMPAKVYLELPDAVGDFRAMPAYSNGAAGLKWVNCHPQNPERHRLPTVMALYGLSDPQTGAPLALMDATLLTAMRTGAAGGVASKHLAQKQPKTLGFVGCGVQAHFLLAAHRVLYPNLELFMADNVAAAAERFAT